MCEILYGIRLTFLDIKPKMNYYDISLSFLLARSFCRSFDERFICGMCVINRKAQNVEICRCCCVVIPSIDKKLSLACKHWQQIHDSEQKKNTRVVKVKVDGGGVEIFKRILFSLESRTAHEKNTSSNKKRL